MKVSWIKAGYETFALYSPKELKVERLAKQVGKNKASFYHYFGDLEVFISLLLAYHLEQAKIVAEKEENCNTQSELIEILVFHKIDLLFNRQLRIHREVKHYKDCFEKVSTIAHPSFMKIWTKIVALVDQPHLAALVLRLGIENFYLQINETTLNKEWLNNYFDQFKKLIQEFRKLNRLHH